MLVMSREVNASIMIGSPEEEYLITVLKVRAKVVTVLISHTHTVSTPRLKSWHVDVAVDAHIPSVTAFY